MTYGLFPIWSGWISQKYNVEKHKGIDIGWLVADGEHLPVRAWKDGEVIASGTDYKGGVYVVLKHANNQWSGYWHLVEGSNIAKGKVVKEGETIGIRGDTGQSSGTHLHFLLTKEGMPSAYNYNTMVNNTINPLLWVYKLKTDNIEKAENHDQYPLPLKPDLPEPVKRDEYKHQVEVLATSLRVRSSSSLSGEVIGFAKQGIYDVLEAKKADGYVWDRIGKDRWIATNDKEGWTKDFPAKDPIEVEVEKLRKELAEKTAQISTLTSEKEKADRELTEAKKSLKSAETKIEQAKKVLA